MLRVLYSCVILILAPVLEASTGFSAVNLAESLEIHPVSSDPSRNARFNWDSRKPLNWSDFRGTPDRQSKFAASANTGMSHSYVISPDGVLIKNASKVKAHFYPYLSWYVPKLINETTLGHEQTHFDISELHARKLRKTIAEFRFTSRSKQEIIGLPKALTIA